MLLPLLKTLFLINSNGKCISKDEHCNKQRLKKILSIAADIAKENPCALRDFVVLLGRKLQSDYMCRAVSLLNEHSIDGLRPEHVWFNEFIPLNSLGQNLYQLKKNANTTRTLNLASDMVLPCTWNIKSVVSCISGIGSEKRCGQWEQDDINHRIEYWLPFGIAWVHGGNHSIMAGIIQGEGVITTEDVYDLSLLFPHVKFDGNAFIRESDNTVINKSTEFEFSAIYEVGRLMHKLGVSV